MDPYHVNQGTNFQTQGLPVQGQGSLNTQAGLNQQHGLPITTQGMPTQVQGHNIQDQGIYNQGIPIQGQGIHTQGIQSQGYPIQGQGIHTQGMPIQGQGLIHTQGIQTQGYPIQGQEIHTQGIQTQGYPIQGQGIHTQGIPIQSHGLIQDTSLHGQGIPIQGGMQTQHQVIGGAPNVTQTVYAKETIISTPPVQQVQQVAGGSLSDQYAREALIRGVDPLGTHLHQNTQPLLANPAGLLGNQHGNLGTNVGVGQNVPHGGVQTGVHQNIQPNQF